MSHDMRLLAAYLSWVLLIYVMDYVVVYQWQASYSSSMGQAGSLAAQNHAASLMQAATSRVSWEVHRWCAWGGHSET